MTQAQPDQSPDEQVHESVKRESNYKVVYSNESDESVPTDVVTNIDEASAESFPASDPPTSTATTPGNTQGGAS